MVLSDPVKRSLQPRRASTRSSCDRALNPPTIGTLGLIFLFVAALTAGQPVSAQGDTCLRRTIPVNVLTERGELVTGLTPLNFKGSLSHKPVKFVSMAADQSPQNAVIAIDGSGSMTYGRSEWLYSLAVAKDFVSGMPANTEIGFALFSTRVQKLIPPTTDRVKLNEELVLLEAEKQPVPKNEGQTALWSSLSTLVSDLIPLQRDDVLYVISDGQDNSSQSQFRKLQRVLSEKQVRFFAFSAETRDMSGGPHPGLIALGLDPLQALQDLASATGGYAVHVSRDPVARLPSRLDNLGKPTAEGLLVLSQFRQAYSFNRAEVEFPEPVTKPREWNVETRGFAAHNLTVLYPRILAGCASH
jgi:von Willebrand factor type A domain